MTTVRFRFFRRPRRRRRPRCVGTLPLRRTIDVEWETDARRATCGRRWEANRTRDEAHASLNTIAAWLSLTAGEGDVAYRTVWLEFEVENGVIATFFRWLEEFVTASEVSEFRSHRLDDRSASIVGAGVGRRHRVVHAHAPVRSVNGAARRCAADCDSSRE